MNPDLYREQVLGSPGAEPGPQPELPLETEGVQRYVWRGQFAEVLIEVVDGQVRVNGAPVAPAAVDPSLPSSR